jgi:hypothetical protein
MSHSKCLMLICIALPTLVSYGEAHCPGNVPSLNLRIVQGSLIVVAVEIDHSGPYDLLVDTGAQVTTVEPSLAAELHLKPQGTTAVSGVGSYARTAYSYIGQIEAGGPSVANSLTVIQEITQLKEADPRIRGILGSTFLQHFDVLIDNRHHLLCLDDSGALAASVKGEQIALAAPPGLQRDLPFTRPILVAARLSGIESASVLLRLDSGSSAAVLFGGKTQSGAPFPNTGSMLKRSVKGVDQSFAVLSPQEVRIGKYLLRQVSFAMPLNGDNNGSIQREDGVLPTAAFERVLISSSGRYVTLEPRDR